MQLPVEEALRALQEAAPRESEQAEVLPEPVPEWSVQAPELLRPEVLELSAARVQVPQVAELPVPVRGEPPEEVQEALSTVREAPAELQAEPRVPLRTAAVLPVSAQVSVRLQPAA